MMPPTPRPASLELAACDPHCFPPRDATPEANDAEMEIVDDEDCRRGRSPGRAPLPFAAVCPPAPRLDGAELEGANPGPTPPRFCTRPPLARGYSALGLDLTSVSPLSPAPSSSPTQQYHAKSVSPPRSFPTRIPMQRRAKSDDLHSRIHTWSSAVARANPIHGAPVHASRPTHRSRTSLSPSDVHNQLDPWAARIGRSRGRTVDMPTARKQW
jgi:hypothetical protein